MNQYPIIHKLVETQKLLVQEIAYLKSTIEELVKIFGPMLPRDHVMNASTNVDIISSSNQARLDGVAPVNNPNLHGDRTIPIVLDSARKDVVAKKTNVTPDVKRRILAMLTYFKQRSNYLGDDLEDKVNMEYKSLQQMAKMVHDEMLLYLKKVNNDTNYLCPWSEVSKEVKLKYSLILERKAQIVGHPIYECIECWCADRLLFQIHKGRYKPKASSSKAKVKEAKGNKAGHSSKSAQVEREVDCNEIGDLSRRARSQNELNQYQQLYNVGTLNEDDDDEVEGEEEEEAPTVKITRKKRVVESDEEEEEEVQITRKKRVIEKDVDEEEEDDEEETIRENKKESIKNRKRARIEEEEQEVVVEAAPVKQVKKKVTRKPVASKVNKKRQIKKKNK